MIRRILQSAVAVLVLSTAACGDDDPSGPLSGTVTVRMGATSFSPANVTITQGSTVRWVNDQAIAHTITPNNPAQAGAWTSQNIAATTNAQFSHTFTTTGTYPYHCNLHSGMTGNITVQ